MAFDLFNPVLLILLGLAYLLVTVVLGTLASAVRHEIERHERVRQAKLRRQGYLSAVASRKKAA